VVAVAKTSQGKNVSGKKVAASLLLLHTCLMILNNNKVEKIITQKLVVNIETLQG
jgi:hypothetical protein